jgi:hypothetical protein
LYLIFTKLETVEKRKKSIDFGNVILYVLQRNHVIKFGENQCKIHKCTQDMVKFYWTFELMTPKSIDFFLFSTVSSLVKIRYKVLMIMCGNEVN